MSETEKNAEVVRVVNQLKEEGKPKWIRMTEKRWQKVANLVNTGELGVPGLTWEKCKEIYVNYNSKKNSKKKEKGETKTTGEGETGNGVVRVPGDCTTLEEAVKRVHGSDRLTTIVVGKGKHIVAGFETYLGNQKRLQIASAMNIVGDPGVNKEEVVVMGGILIEEGIQGNCHLQNLTLRQSNHNGVSGFSSFTMEDVLVKECENDGVYAYGAGVGKCTNVEVRECGKNGVFAAIGGTITLIGAKTKVHDNCTRGYSSDYGLKVADRLLSHSSTIQLVSPLTKEQVSFDNGLEANWGATETADISQIKTIFERVPETEVRVPGNCNTLQEAVKRVHGSDRLTTIVMGKGVHQIDQEYSLKITSAMNIVGDPEVDKSEIEVVGGIRFYGGIQGNCHLQHLTLRQARYVGVRGDSSFTMEDVLVEQCRYYGVWAQGTGGVGRCTNVEVRYCGLSGVAAGNGASITLIGAKTTVHDNCRRRGEVSTDEYGLKVYGSSSSTIQLVFPLTKEQVSLDNGGGDNWGAGVYADIQKIRGVLPPSIQPLYTQLFAACAGRYEQLNAFGFSSETRTYHPLTPTHRMVGILQKLKSQGQLYINYKNEQGLTMLVTACLSGQIGIINVLMNMPQIDGTMTREQFIQCNAFPTTWLGGLELKHETTIFEHEATPFISDCPVRCLPCKHPFEAESILEWLKRGLSYTCPICRKKVENVELMSTELVERWNTMDEKYTKAEKAITEAKANILAAKKALAEKAITEAKANILAAKKALAENNFDSRYRQFVKTKL